MKYKDFEYYYDSKIKEEQLDWNTLLLMKIYELLKMSSKTVQIPEKIILPDVPIYKKWNTDKQRLGDGTKWNTPRSQKTSKKSIEKSS